MKNCIYTLTSCDSEESKGKFLALTTFRQNAGNLLLTERFMQLTIFCIRFMHKVFPFKKQLVEVMLLASNNLHMLISKI